MRRIRSQLTYANVISTLCLVLILGGGAAYAANTVFSTDIVDGEVKTSDLASNAVGTGKIGNNQVFSNDVRDDSLPEGGLSGADIRESTLGKVPNAGGLDGLRSSAFHRYDGTVPSGTTIRGLVAVGGSAADGSHTLFTAVSFPVRAANDISQGDAHIDNRDEPTPETCSGTFYNPTAPPGNVCVYLTGSNNAGGATGAYDAGAPSPYGFLLVVDPQNAGGGVANHTWAQGSWAYTAP